MFETRLDFGFEQRGENVLFHLSSEKVMFDITPFEYI
jgi:hypothetical protein